MENLPPIRRLYDSETGMWYYSVLDAIHAITGTEYPRRYWNELKRKLTGSGCTAHNKVETRRMAAQDGKHYETIVADAETLLRIIQSLYGEAGEPFKTWLARQGVERLHELRHNPASALPLDAVPMSVFAEGRPSR